jgi:hypothetical protein
MVKLDTFPPLDGYMMFAIFDDEIAVDGCIFQLLEFLPSGKLTKNYGKSPCYSWVKQLFRLGHGFQLWSSSRCPGVFWALTALSFPQSRGDGSWKR